MKKFNTLILLLIVNLSYSQDPRLFENSWYLTNTIVNGTNNIPPYDGISIDFSDRNSFTTRPCNTQYASVKFENNETNFSASEIVYTLELCTDITKSSYQDIYFSFFRDEKNSDLVYHFTYKITELLGVKTLIISSMFNKQVVYSSTILSNSSFEKFDFSISPNPSKDFLEIKLNDEFTENTIAEFYNELGQICLTKNLNSATSKIEVSDLISGIYFIKIKSRNEPITKKFIKL
jgi:hypothetical protein